MRILIVDDSPTIRRMVKASLLAIPNVTFVEASTGLEAIETLGLASADLVVLDLNMPDMHCLEVLQFFRRHAAYESMPVIVLTTRGDEQSRQAAMDAGATRYMTKPFAPHVLLSSARELLTRGEEPQPARA
jgi:two-component system, chemotaxis family, chemotaxis protein CheY